MSVIGFNIGSTVSIKDMGLAIDYLLDKDSFEPDLKNIKDTLTNKNKEKDTIVKEGDWYEKSITG